ncbi:MAG: VWA domain-containing protein [Oceanospirillales bacterium]|nr:VWA domain-containing protein [Oceanospirillales bacterium]MBR9886097.1 VWA domain-containing protein [Oceanospirillales bacterium]
MTDLSNLQAIAQQFHFIRPWWLLTILPFAGLFYLQYKRGDSSAQWQKALPKHLHQALTVEGANWKRHYPLHTLAFISLLGAIVCAGPTWERQPSPFREDKTPLIILLDNSEAMLEQDIPLDRLTRAKHKILDLLNLRIGGETALIVYAGSAHLAMPLTRDSAVFKPMLEALSPEIMPKSGKNSASTLRLLKTLLNQNTQPGTVLLISNDVTQPGLGQLSHFFANTPHQLLILAMGNPDRSSKLPLNYDHLKTLADQANGQIHIVSIDNDDVLWVRRQIDYQSSLNLKSDIPWQDMGYYLLIPIMLLMLLWFRRGWIVQWAIAGLSIYGLLVNPASSYAQEVTNGGPTAQLTPAQQVSWTAQAQQLWMDLWLTPDQQGQWYFNQGKYLLAAQHFEDILHKGVAFYYASHFAESHAIFMQSNDKTQALNAANALARQREYIAARSLLQEIIRVHPGYADARHNLAEIEALIEEINRFSESQSKGPDAASESSFELGDEPQTADGAEERVAEEELRVQRPTAEQLLADDSLTKRWLERVEANPKAFLQSKFSIQYRQQLEQ